MAEHLRHELARAGALVRPARILTIAQFLDAHATHTAPSAALMHMLIRRALDELKIDRYREVAGYSGFHQAIGDLIEVLPANDAPPDLARIFGHIERNLAQRGMALRNARLREVVAAPAAQIVFDGFFAFAPAELDLIERLAKKSSVAVTLADWPGSAPSRARLLAAGFAEKVCAAAKPTSSISVFSAPTLQRETEEIARRILAEAAAGRPFREIGIVLRTREPYGPALETTLARFGIPARFYFADSLSDHPAIAYLIRLMHALLNDWDHTDLLNALNMPVSGVGATPEGDAFDFAIREKMPARGLPENGPDLLRKLETLTWSRERHEPLEWAARLKTLNSIVVLPSEFGKVVDEIAAILTGSIPLREFWTEVEAGLKLEPLRASDRRRNVVHVMDVFEARQWALPIVFVCGMVERHFPQYHRENPLLDDAARRRAGLKTSAELQRDESFLYEIATTRATERTILSHARFDQKGEEALRSFFLAGLEAEPCERRVRPAATRAVRARAPRPIRNDAALMRLSELHKKLAATSIEIFLQCPFQFFAGRTMKLRTRPPAPRDRLDVRMQGIILHRALAEFSRAPLLGVSILDEVFKDECRRANIPFTYRTEAIRLELLRNFESFTEDLQVALGWTTRVEEKFSFALTPLVTLTGRIDRLDVGPRDQALVIDYKYSAGAKIRERVNENDSGNLVQGGLYLAAAQRAFGLQPAGMLYCGLRKDVVWDGWHAGIPGLGRIGESRTQEGLQELIDAAVATASRVLEAIASGEIAARPADEKKCVWCDFRDMCRVESAALKKLGAPSS